MTVDPLDELAYTFRAAVPNRVSKTQSEIVVSDEVPTEKVTGPVVGGRINPAYLTPPEDEGIVTKFEYDLNTLILGGSNDGVP